MYIHLCYIKQVQNAHKRWLYPCTHIDAKELVGRLCWRITRRNLDKRNKKKKKKNKKEQKTKLNAHTHTHNKIHIQIHIHRRPSARCSLCLCFVFAHSKNSFSRLARNSCILFYMNIVRCFIFFNSSVSTVLCFHFLFRPKKKEKKMFVFSTPHNHHHQASFWYWKDHLYLVWIFIHMCMHWERGSSWMVR